MQIEQIQHITSKINENIQRHETFLKTINEDLEHQKEAVERARLISLKEIDKIFVKKLENLTSEKVEKQLED